MLVSHSCWLCTCRRARTGWRSCFRAMSGRLSKREHKTRILFGELKQLVEEPLCLESTVFRCRSKIFLCSEVSVFWYSWIVAELRRADVLFSEPCLVYQKREHKTRILFGELQQLVEEPLCLEATVFRCRSRVFRCSEVTHVDSVHVAELGRADVLVSEPCLVYRKGNTHNESGSENSSNL